MDKRIDRQGHRDGKAKGRDQRAEANRRGKEHNKDKGKAMETHKNFTAMCQRKKRPRIFPKANQTNENTKS